MAQLLVSAAINIAISIAINELFPPPDVNQEGPRLTDLGFTSAAYGSFVGITFGTDRVSGNIIDATDPPIEEVVHQESSGGTLFGLKGGGGPQVNTKTFTYFWTGRISWGIEGASDMIRWWGDGKIILDATGTGQIVKAGVTHTFYPGGQTQIQDPEEVTRRGANISAYRHLTSSKVDRMPLADFGNRIPNFTAEIAYNSLAQTPVKNMVQPSGLSTSSSARWDYDPDRNQLLVSKTGSAPAFTADASSMEFRNSFVVSDLVNTRHTMGRDGFAYLAPGFSNRNPITKIDLDSGIEVARFGDSNIGPLSDNTNGFASAGTWYQLSSITSSFGVKSILFHLGVFPAGGSPNGAVVDADQMGNSVGFGVVRHIISTADGLTVGGDDLGGSSIGIPDHDRGVFYIFQDDDNLGKYNLVKYVPNFNIAGDAGIVLDTVTATLVKTFSRGTFAGGDDFEGTGNPAGWAVNRKTGELILSNGTSMILYNPVTDTILAQKVNGSFISEFNYYSGSQFGYAISNATNGTLRVIDTRTLEITKDIKTDDIPWPSGVDGIINGSTSTWDDRVQAIYLGRTGSDASVDFRVLKVFVNRVGGLGVGLDTVVAALSTTYQRQKMAGLLPADIDVTTLAGETVPGFTLNRRSTMKSALEPLRARWNFDGVQSDWIMKFPMRGGAPVLTIPEEDVGELKRGRDQTDTPAVQESRMDDLALPMRLAVRYRNKDIDYQIDYEHDKRQLFPNPTMSSKTELTLDVPIVEQPQAMKRMAQQKLWTAWNERITYKTVVPWTYIKLDATDVFNMGVFGETAQLRMGEMDVGAGWAVEVVGIVEDTKQYSSTIGAGQASGHIGLTVPSSLPTRLTPFDAPILSLQDITLVPLSNAYMVVGAFEDGWPGSTVMKSADDVAYFATGTVNVEAAVGRVKTAPGAWNLVNGDFPNRWQEVADGGTLVIAPLRRADVWTSAANEQIVLSGANTIGIVRASDQQVEILNFENAVLNDNNTVTLTRLLRGRLGTEDIADLGITANDTVVLLSDANNVKESGPIIKQSLTLSELDTVLFFKGVTIGTLIEDAPVISATYTGRDLRPYMPAQISALSDGGGGLDVFWERRARGPLAAEWLDGTGEVVLNETIEQYEVTLSNIGGDFITKIVNDVRTVNFSLAEVNLGGVPGGIAKQPWPLSSEAGPAGTTDGTFDGGGTPFNGGNWVLTNGPDGFTFSAASNGSIPGPVPGSETRVSPASTLYLRYRANGSDTFREARNIIDLVNDLGMAPASIPISTVKANIWLALGRSNDLVRVQLSLMNNNLDILSSVNHPSLGPTPGLWTSVGSLYDASADPWPQRNMTVAMSPSGASKLAMTVSISKFGTTLSNGEGGWDHLELEILTPPPDITVKVVMVSNTGLKSPIAIRQVT